MRALILALSLSLLATLGGCNIFGLVAEAQARFDGLEGLPFREIVKSISAYQLRHRPGE